MHMDVTIEMNEDDREMSLHKGKCTPHTVLTSATWVTISLYLACVESNTSTEY